MDLHIEQDVAKSFERASVRSVLVGISGGADSVALLCTCVRIAPRISLRVEAANCNFHLRGDESDRDSDFTATLCRRLGVPLHSLDYDTSLYMERHPGISTEMACRELRYADFFRILEERGLDRVAVAHNADDDAETMLLALLRGSGTRGLRGMDADNGRVIRPLLGVSRAEIESYLSSIGQDFTVDSSNLASDYRRNFLRRDVIPMLESRWPGVRKSLAKTLSIMKEEALIVDRHYSHQLARLCPDPTTLLIYSEGVVTGTVWRFLHPFGANPAIAEEIIEALERPHGQRRWPLAGSLEAILERDRLVVVDSCVRQPEPSVYWERLRMTPELMAKIKSNRSHDIVYLPNGQHDYELRSPLTGERMAPLGMRGTRLISDIVSDAGLDRKAKEGVRVLVKRSDGKIVWLPGLKRSRYDLVDANADYVYMAVYNSSISGIINT